MGVPLEFAANIATKRLSKSSVVDSPFTLPSFALGDTISFAITLVKPNPAGGSVALSTIPGAGTSVKATIGVAGGAELNSVSLVANGDVHEGDLALNVAGILALTAPLTKDLEFEILNGSGYWKMLFTVNLTNRLATPVTVPATPADEVLGKNEARALYAAKAGCDQIVMIDQTDGSLHYFAIVSGQVLITPIT
jgi:hypothetical protein